MRRSLRLLALLAILSAPPSTASAAFVVVDHLAEILPPNGCLPVTQRPIVFDGQYCDGVTCPPGTITTGCPAVANSTGQLGLPSILQNGSNTVLRVVKVDQESTSGFTTTGEIRADLARWRVSGNDPAGAISYLRYSAAAWNLSFVSMGVLSIQVVVEGEISPSRPLHCTVQLIDQDVAFRYGSKTVAATAPGTVTFALGTFFVNNGFDFTGIDEINFTFSDCPFGFCTPPVSARSYVVGPPLLEVPNPTPATTASWGRIKQIYR